MTYRARSRRLPRAPTRGAAHDVPTQPWRGRRRIRSAQLDWRHGRERQDVRRLGRRARGYCLRRDKLPTRSGEEGRRRRENVRRTARRSLLRDAPRAGVEEDGAHLARQPKCNLSQGSLVHVLLRVECHLPDRVAQLGEQVGDSLALGLESNGDERLARVRHAPPACAWRRWRGEELIRQAARRLLQVQVVGGVGDVGDVSEDEQLGRRGGVGREHRDALRRLAPFNSMPRAPPPDHVRPCRITRCRSVARAANQREVDDILAVLFRAMAPAILPTKAIFPIFCQKPLDSGQNGRATLGGLGGKERGGRIKGPRPRLKTPEPCCCPLLSRPACRSAASAPCFSRSRRGPRHSGALCGRATFALGPFGGELRT